MNYFRSFDGGSTRIKGVKTLYFTGAGTFPQFSAGHRNLSLYPHPNCLLRDRQHSCLHRIMCDFWSTFGAFSSPEAAIHLASAMDRDLWPAPIFSPRFTDFRSFCAVSCLYQNGGPGNKFWTRNSKFQRHHIERKTIRSFKAVSS